MITAFAPQTQKIRQKYALRQHPVKTTALNYIREAIEDERYEEVREMIAIAKEFGAGPWDIRIAFIPGFDKRP